MLFTQTVIALRFVNKFYNRSEIMEEKLTKNRHCAFRWTIRQPL